MECVFECNVKLQHSTDPVDLHLVPVAEVLFVIRNFIQHQDGRLEENDDAYVEDVWPCSDSAIDSPSHCDVIAPLLEEDGCSHPDFQPILDKALFDAMSLLDKDKASRQGRLSPIPIIKFSVKRFTRCNCQHDCQLELPMAQPQKKPIPATKESIEALKKVKADAEGDDECMICMKQLSLEEDDVTRMPCSHRFHGRCIEEWLNTSHTCPLCRFPMPTASDGADSSINAKPPY